MRNDLTDLTVVVDRSWSMRSCQVDAEKGLNQLISDQKEKPGICTFTLVMFDDQYEVAGRAIDIRAVGHVSLSPRGNTALLYALGRTIDDTGVRLASMLPQDRPGLVIVATITDGEENSSHLKYPLYTKAQIKEKIQHQREKYGWAAPFLGANFDAFAEGTTLGIAPDSTSNYDVKCVQQAFRGMSNSVTRMREAVLTGAPVVCSYTSDEVSAMTGQADPQVASSASK